MRLVRRLPLAALLLMAATAPAEAQSIFDSPREIGRAAGFEFPMAPDTFDVTRLRVAPVTSLGLTVGYATPLETRSDFTLYLFDNNQGAEEHFDQASSEMVEYLVQRGDSITLELVEEGPISVEGTDGVTYDGFRAEGRYTGGEMNSYTWLYVFEKDGQLIKHRATTQSSSRERLRPHVEAFVAETLGTVRVMEDVMPPGQPLWAQEVAPLRLGEVHLPIVADSFAMLEFDRNVIRQRGYRAVYRGQEPHQPIVNAVLMAKPDTALMSGFALGYGSLRRSLEQQGIEFEEEDLMRCEWVMPAGLTNLVGYSGALRFETGGRENFVQTFAVDPTEDFFLVLQLTHRPDSDATAAYPAILPEIATRLRTSGEFGRVGGDAVPTLSAVEGR